MAVSAQARGKLATAMGDFGAAEHVCNSIDAGAGVGSDGKWSVFGVTAVVRAAAYTQTFATAGRTHSNPTAVALTVADGVGTNDGAIGAITNNATTITAVQELAAAINALIVDLANVKGVVNSLNDDAQAYGLAQ